MRQSGQLILVQSIECVNCWCTNTSKSRDTCVSVKSCCRGLFEAFAKVQSVSFSLVYSLHIAYFSSSLCLSRHGPFIGRSAQLFHRSNEFIQLLHPSRCSQSILTIVCFCLLFCTSDVGRCPILLQWSVGSLGNGKQILQTCNVVVVLEQRLTSFQQLRSSSL